MFQRSFSQFFSHSQNRTYLITKNWIKMRKLLQIFPTQFSTFPALSYQIGPVELEATKLNLKIKHEIYSNVLFPGGCHWVCMCAGGFFYLEPRHNAIQQCLKIHSILNLKASYHPVSSILNIVAFFPHFYTIVFLNKKEIASRQPLLFC